MSSDTAPLRFALPNKGRLREPALRLLRRSGYRFRARDRALEARCTNAAISFIFVRADDIPVLVDSGVVDMGITGQDLVGERGARIHEVLPLDFGACRLCVAVPESSPAASAAALADTTIATSFPRITGDYFAARNISVRCVELHGSVEIMVALRLADAIVDLVESGDTLRDNQLRVLETVGNYQSAVFCHPALADDPRVATIRRRLEGISIADRYSVLEYNILKNQLSDATAITPGYNSPTISNLDDQRRVAVKVMVEKFEIAEVMDRLEAAGATAILETELNNCRL